ncbi:peptidase M15, partial [Mesorhizobium sp. M7A.F.Ca.CA.002.14.1.2]
AEATATTEQAVATAHAPASVPFGMADATASADATQVAVNNIPLPTWRPDNSLPAALAAPPSKDVLMALAETADQGKTATDAFSVLPTARPEMARPDAVKAVLDEANAQVGAADYQLASLSGSEPRSAFNDPGTNTASPRDAVVARPVGSDPAAAIGAGVKTTRKESRATARDLKPGPKAMVVAAAPQAARWALTSGEQVATVSSATTAPGYAYSIVHTPPSEVYTAGFQPSSQVADANRFTGNAVKFMSVARFQTK